MMAMVELVLEHIVEYVNIDPRLLYMLWHYVFLSVGVRLAREEVVLDVLLRDVLILPLVYIP